MDTDQPPGEIPPAETLHQLRALFTGMRHRAADQVWQSSANWAVTLFEGYRSA